MTIDIICSVLDGERFLPDLLASLQAQSHGDWRLWLRDDGSTDGTVDIVTSAASRDPRIRVLHLGGPRLGAAQSFGWLLERIPAEPSYVMTADADDVWLPHKIEQTLTAMVAAESTYGPQMPVLVHTDLTVVDADLRELHPSFWTYSGLTPEPATLRRLVVRNVATGPTVMINAALRERIGRTPVEATYQDWWYALVAAAVGRVVALHQSTVLYRQHGANSVGALQTRPAGLAGIPGAIRQGFAHTEQFRLSITKTAAQARALLECYGSELGEQDRRFLSAYARIPEQSFFRRKLDMLRLRVLPEYGLMQTVGVVLRG